MSTWDDRFTQHPLFVTLQTAEGLLAETPSPESISDMEALARLARVVEYVGRHLKATDPQLVPLSALDNLNTAVGQINAEMQAYKSDSAPGHLSSANTYADNVLEQSLRLAARTTADDVQELQSAVTSFRRSAGQFLGNVERAADDLRAKIAGFGTELAAHEQTLQMQETRVDTITTQFQQQFSQSQQQHQTEVSELLQEGRTQIAAVITEAKTESRDALATRNKEFGAALASAKESSDSLIADIDDRSTTLLGEFKTSGDERIAELDGLLEKAVKTVGVIGNTGMTGGYKIAADAEAKAANRLRLLAIVALAGAVGAAALFAVFHPHGLTWETFASKAFISVPLLLLAGYAAKESSKHRHQAQIARQIELQLASIDSYLVELPEDEKHQIKAKLADRFFGEFVLAPGDVDGLPAIELKS